MEIGTIRLTDFRNYEDEEVLLTPGINLVVGGNGQGKTNLLEAVHVLCAGTSHRAASSALPRHGAERAIVRGSGSVRERRVQVDIEIRNPGGVRTLVNKASAAPGSGPLLSVVFAPEDLALVKGGPEERRRLLDGIAGALRPVAAAQRQEFERVVRQRNGALKAAQANPRAFKSLAVWDEQFVALGTSVVMNRLEALGRVGPVVAAHYRRLASGAGDPGLGYEAAWASPVPDDEDSIAAALGDAISSQRQREIERGAGLVGPQRDDLSIELRGADARTFASQGEQRTLSLAFRLAQRDVLAEEVQESPILLLDDVFSELDDRRREELSDLIQLGGQSIATATSPSGIPAKAAQTLFVEKGTVHAG